MSGTFSTLTNADNSNDPPEVSFALLKNKDLKTSKPWQSACQSHLPIDILLLTAKECEFLSCVSHLDDGFFRSYDSDLGCVYFGEIGEGLGGEGEAKKLKIGVIQCNVGSSGVKGSLVVVKNAVGVLRPKAVFCVGFCGGLNDKKVKLGDVVVLAKLITYSNVKITKKEVQDRGIKVPLSKHLLGLITTADHGWEAPLKDPQQLEVTVHKDGVFLSGPEVVDNEKRRAELTKKFPEAIAIEMEGEGLFTAAHDLNIEWVVIKGVSDFADGKKSNTDSWRPFASTMAASLTAHMLKDPTVFQKWPHYGSKDGIAASAAEESLTTKKESVSDSTHATKRRKRPRIRVCDEHIPQQSNFLTNSS